MTEPSVETAAAIAPGPTIGELQARLADLGPADRRRLGRRLDGLRGQRHQERRAQSLNEIAAQVSRSEDRLARRRESVPALNFPPELPVSDRVDDLAAAIAAHQVIIVAGETGSGKSTQLPKICLQLGRGVTGMIGHTQPRRIAARALAERIAEETGTEVGGVVGYAIRFGDHTGPNTLIKLMTDGILLAEIHRDRDLLAYDTIIIDEAHERSLNIDFLLGYLTELLPRRPDLKVLITSATIDPERFSRHFGGAPVVEVSGRTYPVEVRYRPYGLDGSDHDDGEDGGDEGRDDAQKTPTRRRPTAKDSEIDQAQAICQAVDELAIEGDGDVLVFLSGEREITDTAEVLRGHLAYRPGVTEVLPLYGRLSAADQHRVFSAHQGRRIVLSTNVAETSLTVPGVRYVIDPGTARISRYSVRSKVQRLPIERISQASAGQRAGRCGRVADGICIRLYSEEDYRSRPEFTDPEISRTSLASVILQMAAMELGDIATFPFVEPPDSRQISDGITVLNELGALQKSTDGTVRLTPTGHALSQLPVDPRLARMIVEGDRRGCLDEMLIVTAALAIQDVREYPLDDRDRATAAHSRFADPKSDFLALLNLWKYLQTEAKARSGNAFRRMCKSEYLHYLRIREWQDLHAQLRQVARGLKMDTQRAANTVSSGSEKPSNVPAAASEPGSASKRRRGHKSRVSQRPGGRPVSAPSAGSAGLIGSGGSAASTGVTQPAKAASQQGRGSLADAAVDGQAVHVALLAGLLSHVGLKSEAGREYQGTRGSSFLLWPGSALAKNPPRLVVAAELVETSRLWGRINAAVEPEWVEEVGGELLRRSYSEPRWDARRASVLATEKVTLLGVTLIGARTVQYDRIDPAAARELFIRHALVEGDWDTRHPFFAANQQAMDKVAEQEDRVRRRDILLDDESLFELYNARIPADVTSGRHFDAWWRRASRSDPGLLTFTPEMLIASGADLLDETAYPDRFTAGGLDLDLDYVFEPGRADDGVSVTIPLAVLSRVDPARFDAQIPGLRRDLAIALLRSLPKTLRRNFVPAPDFADAALAGMTGQPSALPQELAASLTSMTGIVVTAADFDLAKVPEHLRMTFRVVDSDGRQVAAGKDLSTLQSDLRAHAREAVATVSGTVERRGLTAFPSEGLQRSVTTLVHGHEVIGYPALVDEGAAVGISVFTSAADQSRAMRAGTRRLLTLALPVPVAHVKRGLTREQQLTLATTGHGTLGTLLADATEAAIDALLDWAGGPAWDAAGFRALTTRLQPQLPRAVLDIVAATESVLVAAHQAAVAINAVNSSPAKAALAGQVADMRRELATLLAPGFITATTAAQLPDLTRYLQALTIRAQRVRENPERDRQRMSEVGALADELDAAVGRLRPERAADPDVRQLRRLLAELRVAMFAQPMRTAVPVSAKRVQTALAGLAD